MQEQQRRLQELCQLPGAVAGPAGPVAEAGQCFDIRSIDLQGATLPDEDARRALPGFGLPAGSNGVFRLVGGDGGSASAGANGSATPTPT